MSSSNDNAWQQGKPHELAFWDHWMATRGDRWPQEFAARLDPETPLQDYIQQVLPPSPRAVRILDVGAGPITWVGKRCPGHELDITPIDALADDYNALLHKHGIVPPLPTQACEGERMKTRFPPRSFDVVHARNSLDHCRDPLLVLQQMFLLCKPHGHVILVHFDDEAEKADYEGFHQWNLKVGDGDLVIWNKAHRHSLRQRLQPVADWVGIGRSEDDLPVVTWKKRQASWLSPQRWLAALRR